MKFRDEYRDAAAARRLASAIADMVTRSWTIMEICGGQTHAILRFGIDALLPPEISLVHGPGCPVCVTPADYIDKAIAIAADPDVILCSFGDMMRVRGTKDDLFAAKSRGGDVRMVYSPLDAVDIARREPARQVVFFAVGFETTAPANAMAALHARAVGLGNFSMLASHVLVPPAMDAILAAPDNRIQGFLAAGHVCTIMGLGQYEQLAHRHHVPIVATGFEPVDILEGLFRCVRQMESGRAEVENAYGRSVRQDGNRAARAALDEVFEIVPRRWRGMGEIPASGLALRPAFSGFDAERRFGAVAATTEAVGDCISGAILRGECKPPDCAAFGTRCTPERPLGVPMVSSEGACAAYYAYRGKVA